MLVYPNRRGRPRTGVNHRWRSVAHRAILGRVTTEYASPGARQGACRVKRAEPESGE